ncbi:hypothetical protein J4032_15640 [Streptomyces formicae]|uniref:Integral membrane protein n=1 Tax=Streptomyces formicae TaxID=1616117 RepID=A0ABY3WMS8_9ACTN|nr:hypothetical protein [Streptomyces formicae]UNM12759.1 hypothetical protein J4032_15640 [Streptomyces formicae]
MDDGLRRRAVCALGAVVLGAVLPQGLLLAAGLVLGAIAVDLFDRPRPGRGGHPRS